MSWEAVTWASKQRMKLPHEQLILLVLANCADPSGVAFAEWPGREHWWKYLVDRTRLSKSSLFRHINTIIELGLCTRSTLVLADGTRRPTLRLDLSAAFDIEDSEQHYSHERDQSHGETEAEQNEEEPENTNDISHSQEEIESPGVQSHHETSPTGGTGPFPIVGMHKDSLSCSKESPPTPQGGASVADDGFEEFLKVWREPIPKMALARSAWVHIPTAKRTEVIASARGYFVWLSKQSRPPATVSAQSFLRDSAGWSQWLPWAGGSDVPAFGPSVFAPGSIEAKSITVLHEIANRLTALRTIWQRSDGSISFPKPMTPQLAALAQAPPQSDWPTLDRQQAGAWEGLLRQFFEPEVIRAHMREGSRAPWAWPPRKDGTLSTAGPAEVLMSDQDMADFK